MHPTGEENEQGDAPALAESIAEEAKAEANAVLLQLHDMLAFLRTHFCYCLWCGSAYDSLEQLQESCPGESEEDH